MPNQEIRYSFKFKDGNLPNRNGKLSWVSSFEQAKTEAKSWNAESVVKLKENKFGLWDIIEEVAL